MMMQPLLYRPHPELDWSQPDGPRARVHGDVYFSAEDGLAETRSVFLQGCHLEALFQQAAVPVIAELGFGTGLNFLATWDLFRRITPETARLHFVSIEGFPLRREDAARALSHWPELKSLADELLSAWPGCRVGPHRRHFDNGRVTLTVFHDGIEAALPQMELIADAWFLDGFSPALNPDMWTQEVFGEMARMSRPGARVATFTVAGAVRRGLQTAGFSVSKEPGFGRKRERLEAVYEGQLRQEPASLYPRARLKDGPLVILGGGIAAASLVEASRRRGLAPVVVAQGGWAKGASGAPRGLLTPRLEAADRPHVRALLSAFDYARWQYSGLDAFKASGVLRCGPEPARLEKLADLMGDGYCLEERGLRMDQAGHFNPETAIEALSDGCRLLDRYVSDIRQTSEGWQLCGEDGKTVLEAGHLIMACGSGLGHFDERLGLETEQTAGQIMIVPNTQGWNEAIAGPVYMIPFDDRILIGATHEKPGFKPKEEVIQELAGAAEDMGLVLTADQRSEIEVWKGIRGSYSDRLPVYGSLPGPGFDALYSGLQQGRGPSLPQADIILPGLSVLGGFGARGFSHAPLLAEALISDLCDEPGPLERSGRVSLHPARFAERLLRRR